VDQTGARLDLVAEARRQWRAHGWIGPDRGMAAVISLMRAQQIVLGRLEDVVRPFGLSYARYEVLMLLTFSRSGELPLTRIGERLQVHPASVTGAVAKLEAQGLLVREPHPGDRRAVLARITDEGRRRAEASTAALNAGPFADLGLSDDAAEQLVDVIAELRRGAGDF
jgi:DNA-binding MarR family transcriptional regulator